MMRVLPNLLAIGLRRDLQHMMKVKENELLYCLNIVNNREGSTDGSCSGASALPLQRSGADGEAH